jgi:hypothetical protein
MSDPSGIAHKALQVAGNLSRLDRLIRQDQPEDPKRYAVLRATQGLLLAFVALVAADVVCIVAPTSARTLTAAAVTLTLGVGASVATLAGVAHKKPDDVLPGGANDPQ